MDWRWWKKGNRVYKTSINEMQSIKERQDSAERHPPTKRGNELGPQAWRAMRTSPREMLSVRCFWDIQMDTKRGQFDDRVWSLRERDELGV